MKVFGLLFGAGVLALAAGQADATVNLYIGQGGSSAATKTGTGPDVSYLNQNGKLYYNGTVKGFDIQVSATGAPTVPSPQLLTNSIDVSSSAAGSVSLYVVQDMVTSLANSLVSSFTTNTLTGVGTSVDMATFYSATDPFATGSLKATALSNVSFSNLKTFTQTKSLNGVTQPFYEIAKYTINFKGAGTVNSTINLTAGAVPEPASWAMMLMGFGFMGYALRQRRGAKVSFG